MPRRRLVCSVLAIAAATAFAGLTPACKSGEGQGVGTGAPIAATPTATIEADGRRATFRIELARTQEEHARGLMFRQHLAPDAGMLFVFDRERDQVFWMKNTLIPLDMIFIGNDLRIVGIVANAEPQTLTPRRVDGPSRYVLEIAGGVAAQHGMRAGQRVELRGVDAAP